MKGGWVKHSFGIETQLIENESFDHDGKRESDQKHHYNTLNCAFYCATKHFWECIGEHGPCHILGLEGVYCGTCTRLIEECGADPKLIDIVSCNVRFRPAGPKDQARPRTYTGQLLSFLKKQPNTEESLYDVVILDFCCAWSDDIEACFVELFKRKLLRDISTMSVTFSQRPKKTEFTKENAINYRWRMTELARKYGYEFGYSDSCSSGPAMLSFFIKVMRPTDALDKDHPIKSTKAITPWEWLKQPVLLEDAKPFVYSEPKQKKIKK